ncbi:MAG: hypothetical protein HRU24_04745 [Gammaproteobacteria bacterium]|nr:hypothetical protein [Gammaproteobacteria bacterium]
MKNILKITATSLLLISASSVLTINANELTNVAQEAKVASELKVTQESKAIKNSAAVELKKLDSLEIQPVKQLSFKDIIKNLDTDQSGTLSWSEVKNSDDELLQNAFSKIDLDKDAEITEFEFNTFLEPVQIQS